MDLNKLIWDNSIPFSDRLHQLGELELILRKEITNNKELPFDMYYKFPIDLDSVKTINQKWKMVRLAKRIIVVAKRWDRMYSIDFDRVASGNVFVDFFKNAINVSKYNMCSIGINFYHRDGYTFKTFMLWANNLVKKGVITNKSFNSFMKYLEEISNERRK